MAIFKCPECGGAVSTEAPACPHCGKPNSAVQSAPGRATAQTPTSAAVQSDVSVWTGRTSQWVNLDVFIACAIFCWLVVPIFVAIWRYLLIRNQRYELTDQRLRIYRGVLSRRVDEIELYRVKDSRFEQSFFMRLVGLGNVLLMTSDVLNPGAVIVAIPDARQVREQLRNLVESRRAARGVRMTELE